MKRIILLEIDVANLAELRRVERAVAYASWGALSDPRKPVVKTAESAKATMMLRAAWEAIP